MDPRAIQDSQFAPVHFLYEREGFTVAFGRWEDKDYAVAMRWDGDGDSPGFPRGVNGKAKWFAVKPELRWPLLCALLSAPPMQGGHVAGLAAALNVLAAERPGGPEDLLHGSQSSHWQDVLGKIVCIEPISDLDDPQPSQFLFRVEEVTAADVKLQKQSNEQYMRVPLFALSRPWGKETDGGLRATILCGALRFRRDTQRWRWIPEGGALDHAQQAPSTPPRTLSVDSLARFTTIRDEVRDG